MFSSVPLFIGASVLWTVSLSSSLALALVLREVFHALTGEARLDWSPWTLLGIFAAFTLARGVLFVPAPLVISHFLSVRLETLVQRNLFRSILNRRPLADPPSQGDLINRFRDDVDAVVRPLTMPPMLIGYVAIVSVSFIILYRISPIVAVVFFLPGLATLGLTRALGLWIKAYRREVRSTTGEVTGSLGELFGAVQALQVAGTERAAVRHFDRLSDARRKASLKETLLDAIMGSVTLSTFTLTVGVVLLSSAHMMRAGSLTVGDLVLLVGLIESGYMAYIPSVLGQQLANLQRAQISLQRIAPLLQDESVDELAQSDGLYLRGSYPDVPPLPSTTEKLDTVGVRGLTYRYPGSSNGVENINLRLERGSFTVVTGRIGSGKTTLLEVLLGLLPMDAGEITWNGRAVREPREVFVPPRCAYTPQTPWLFSDTLRNNILMGLSENEAELSAAIYLGVMERDVAELEKGLETVVGPRGVRLSGGQVQRTAAARMFVRQPELLVFDDLSSALDVETEQQLWERQFELPEITSLVVSHRRVAYRRADHIVVLKPESTEGRPWGQPLKKPAGAPLNLG